jgi:hypothetical protein
VNQSVTQPGNTRTVSDRPQPCRRARLRIETLEDRSAPSAYFAFMSMADDVPDVIVGAGSGAGGGHVKTSHWTWR